MRLPTSPLDAPRPRLGMEDVDRDARPRLVDGECEVDAVVDGGDRPRSTSALGELTSTGSMASSEASQSDLAVDGIGGRAIEIRWRRNLRRGGLVSSSPNPPKLLTVGVEGNRGNR